MHKGGQYGKGYTERRAVRKGGLYGKAGYTERRAVRKGGLYGKDDCTERRAIRKGGLCRMGSWKGVRFDMAVKR